MKPVLMLWLISALLVVGSAAAQAPKKPGEAVRVEEIKVKGRPAPGGEVIAVVSFVIDEGYHTHSNKPSEPNFIATALTVSPVKGVQGGAAVYPKGKAQKVAGLDKPLSLYEGQFTVSVPLKLEAGVTLPVKVPASLRYQACQGAQCFPPKTLKLEIPIAAADPAK